jgi:DNA helicase-2/ATP-dependent DNA helicase PcrA
MDYLAGLNEPQREAVIHDSGPLLILAGAGSGKTSVVTRRILRLMQEKGVPGHRMLGVTFTNKAAKEMLERVERMKGSAVSGMWLTTFHSMGAMLLRRHPEAIARTGTFVIYDDSDQAAMVSRTMRDMGINDRIYSPRAVQHQINTAKNFGLSPKHFHGSDFLTDTVARVYPVYEERMIKANAVDFGDLLYLVVYMFEHNEDIRQQYATRFEHVMVDEFQDTNPVQYKLLQQLTTKHRNLVAVGDDDQCLVRGTLVTMADGSKKPIEEVKVGDEVLSARSRGVFGAATVTDVFAKRFSGEAIRVTTESGRQLTSTPEHTHFVARQNHCFVHDDLLQANITLCDRASNEEPIHNLKLFGSTAKNAEMMRALDLPVRSLSGDFESWIVEYSHDDYGKLAKQFEELLAKIPAHFEVERSYLANWGPNWLPRRMSFMEAAKLEEKMRMLSEQNEYDEVSRVERVKIDEEVFDLNVERTHNFIANGIVTHNSIYKWRGADIKNILGFSKDFPDAKVIKLEENYRSTKTIIKAAAQVIRNNFGRHDKMVFTNNVEGEKIQTFTLDDERREAEVAVGIVRGLSTDHGIPLSEIAVFYRTHAQSRAIEEGFQRAKLPYRVVGGLKFYDRAEVKDLLAYLKVLLNKSDIISWERIINVPARGIGDSTFDKISAHSKKTGENFWDAMRAAAKSADMLSTGPKKKVIEFGRLMADLYDMVGKLTPSELAREVLAKTGYLEILRQEDTPESEARVENLTELLGSMSQYEQESETPETLEKFLERVSLVNQDDEDKSKTKERVTLMTIHAAKGLEFAAVLICGLEEGIFPHARSREDVDEMEEERRLCYVAITRAKKKLYLLNAKRRRLFGQEQASLPSRFLSDIPKELLLQTGNSNSSGRLSALQPAWSPGSGMTAAKKQSQGFEEGVDDMPSYDDSQGSPRMLPVPEKRISVTPMATSANSGSSSFVKFRAGMQVRHSVFGVGEVRNVSAPGPAGILTIYFPNGGMRKIQASYVKPA